MFGKDLTPGLTVALVVALGLSACGSGSTVSASDGSFAAKDSNDNRERRSVDQAGHPLGEAYTSHKRVQTSQSTAPVEGN
jgi:hypothetical protein